MELKEFLTQFNFVVSLLTLLILIYLFCFLLHKKIQNDKFQLEAFATNYVALFTKINPDSSFLKKFNAILEYRLNSAMKSILSFQFLISLYVFLLVGNPSSPNQKIIYLASLLCSVGMLTFYYTESITIRNMKSILKKEQDENI